MRYTSTRSASTFCTFEEAILGGYTQDGGLYVPETLPSLSMDTLKSWTELSYVDLATELLSLFVTEMDKDQIRDICQAAYAGFDAPTVPVLEITNSASRSIFVAELFHGPTFCFKDLGLRILINFMAHFAQKRRQPITLVVATTGDTGPAAVQAVEDAGSDLLSIVVHYPKGQISDFQRRQLTTVNSNRVKIVEFEGSGDDMDSPIKSIISDKTFANTQDHLICGINSFNIGRPIAQITHFVWTYLRVAQMKNMAPDSSNFVLDIIIPTGAMGNMIAAYMAKKMGLPFGIFTAGVNVNDFTDIAFTTGLLSPSPGPMKMTLSEAINIQFPYNLERLLYYMTGEKHELIHDWYQTLGETGKVQLEKEWQAKLKEEFRSCRISDEELCVTMNAVLQEFNYWIDPHTGVAFASAKRLGYWHQQGDTKTNDNSAVVIMATASPCKFQAALTVALGEAKWKQYESQYFPERGRAVLLKQEVQPVAYKALPGVPLSETQKIWEKNTRGLIDRSAVLVNGI